MALAMARTERHSSHADAGLTFEGSQGCRLDVFPFPQVAAAISGALLMSIKLNEGVSSDH